MCVCVCVCVCGRACQQQAPVLHFPEARVSLERDSAGIPPVGPMEAQAAAHERYAMGCVPLGRWRCVDSGPTPYGTKRPRNNILIASG